MMTMVSVKQLMSAIEEAEPFQMPEMNAGTHYLYDELYTRLTSGKQVQLSRIRFDRFELEDINFLRNLHSDTLEANVEKAEALARAVQDMPPVPGVSVFV